MRKVNIYLILVSVLFTVGVLFTNHTNAQTPEMFSYQAVVRDLGNNLVVNQPIGVQISIFQGIPGGTPIYTETHTPTTNANGLFTIIIGNGFSGEPFSAINWSLGPFYLQTEVDPAGGTNYSIIGNSQMLSVPFALYAKTAENFSGSITETDPIWSTSPAFEITNSNILNWDSAYGWGNHANAGYLSDYTETDPSFAGSQAANITANDITKLNNLSGTNTGDQDLSGLATKTALNDSIANVRSEIPDVSTFITTESDPSVAANFDFSGSGNGKFMKNNGTKWVSTSAITEINGMVEVNSVAKYFSMNSAVQVVDTFAINAYFSTITFSFYNNCATPGVGGMLFFDVTTNTVKVISQAGSAGNNITVSGNIVTFNDGCGTNSTYTFNHIGGGNVEITIGGTNSFKLAKFIVMGF